MQHRLTDVHENLYTLELYLREQSERIGPGLRSVLLSIALAGKCIARSVQRARIEDVIGGAGDTNLHGESQQKLDIMANELLKYVLEDNEKIAVVASEEEDEALVLRTRNEGGRYCVLFDPLDGSSNIEVAVGIGTIFSVLPNDCADGQTADSVLQPGRNQLAAGYVLLGSQVVMVLTTGMGVDMFVLDPTLGEFVLVEKSLRIPDSKKIYSINEAYVENYPDPGFRKYLDHVHRDGYTGRYIGSMIADVHRTLIKGGVFIYPALKSHPKGKLRLLYEANPMGMLVEQAGGRASTGRGSILDVLPGELHERTEVIMGSSEEVELVEKFIG